MNKILRALFLTASLSSCLSYTGGYIDQRISPGGYMNRSSIKVSEAMEGLSDEDIVELIEQGQRDIQRIMTTGTPEEQEEFMRMMQETMNSFTEEDFEEIDKISKIVEPLLLEKEAQFFKEQEAELIKSEPVKTEVKKEVVISGDTSLEYMLHKINKTITSVFVKVKSDYQLTEILKQWSTKDDFNELVRLLQALNNKSLIAKLTSSKTDDIKKLVETIENFNKRLEIENKQFTVADTFGLEVDKETSAQNSMKLHKILEFFQNSTETLLPMITNFLKEFEPEALLLVKSHDEKAKNSLDAAKKIEKISNQRRPFTGYTGSENAPSYVQDNNYNQQKNYTPSRYDGYTGNNSTPQGRRAQNKINNNNESNVNLPAHQNATKNPADQSEKKEDQKNKPENKSEKTEKKVDNLKPVLDAIERFDDMFDRNSFDDYSKLMTKAIDTFHMFGKEASFNENDYETFLHPEFRGTLHPNQAALKSIFDKKVALYGKNIKAAHAHLGELKNPLDLTFIPIKEIKSIVESTRKSLANLNINDLYKLQNSNALKILKMHFNSYESTFKRVQKELKHKHKVHKLEVINQDEVKSYNELENKIESLHGLDRLITEVRASFELLDRAIQAEIKRRKRDASKPQTN